MVYTFVNGILLIIMPFIIMPKILMRNTSIMNTYRNRDSRFGHLFFFSKCGAKPPKFKEKEKAGFLYHRDEVQIFGLDCNLQGNLYWITIQSSIRNKLRKDDDSCIPYPFYEKSCRKAGQKTNFLLRENGPTDQLTKDRISPPFICSGRHPPQRDASQWVNLPL